MSKLIILSLLFYITFNIIKLTKSETNECQQINPCKCEFENGTGINLNELNLIDPWIAEPSTNISTFFFHPCTDSNKIASKLPDDKNNDCKSGYSV